MDEQKVEQICHDGHESLQKTLGYLNFSSGSPDTQFLKHLNRLYELIDAERRTDAPKRSRKRRRSDEPAWRWAEAALQKTAAQLRRNEPAFSNVSQASAVIELVFDGVIPAFRRFHGDLLGHQSSDFLFGPFMVGRMCELALKHGPPFPERDQAIAQVLHDLNDYVGYRPVPTLETHKHEPYPNEWTRPIPLYIKDAGVARGTYQTLVSKAIDCLRKTSDELLRAAFFDLEQLDELALDARAYDFEHPVNKRPNYQFGLWDPHSVDNRGFYRRFVVHQVTLDALLSRVERDRKQPRERLLDEAAAVLAGTILMASGVSGSGPNAHDSNTTLSTLLPVIAGYRDAYYEQLLRCFPKEHVERLTREAAELHQPFGAARQHLNTELAQRRATQMERSQLARLFARMGYPDAARSVSKNITVASARMTCQIDCHLSNCQQAIQNDDLHAAASQLTATLELIRRGINCGAIVDPWNILGFDANFSLFPAIENTVYDHRVDDLVESIEQTFLRLANVWSRAAAADDQELCQAISQEFETAADWWHQFAAHEVNTIDTPSARETFQAASHVAEALNLWHKGGAESGDVRFWAPYVENFGSGKSYELVLETLLAHDDFVASMALLVHWMGQASEVPLESGDASFHRLAVKWMSQLLHVGGKQDGKGRESRARKNEHENADSDASQWPLVRKFFDYLEANADEYWNVPEFTLNDANASRTDTQPDEFGRTASESAEDDEDLFSAAYENVVYRDSTDDGVEGQIFEFEPSTNDEFEAESERVVERVAFLATLANLWSITVLSQTGHSNAVDRQQYKDQLRQWYSQASKNRRSLISLLDVVGMHAIGQVATNHDAMVQYDRKRLIKESLLDQIIAACVETADAERFIVIAMAEEAQSGANVADLDLPAALEDDERLAISVLCHVRRADVESALRTFPELISCLNDLPILYVPQTKDGRPREIVAAQIRRRLIESIIVAFPRLGLLAETRELIDTVRRMERHAPVGPGAVTQFDELFDKGHRALVEAIVDAADRTESAQKADWDEKEHDDSTRRLLTNSIESDLVDCLERITESMLLSWLAHSRTLRLSVMEKVSKEERWEKIVQFIRTYGHDIFTQHFLNLANLRAILHQGMGDWLERMEEETYGMDRWPLLDDLDSAISREDAVKYLSFVLEAVVENYAEYREYNSTTTQSDRGELLFTLLDFLRLRATYDRVAWNLRPVTASHEVLVRRGHNGAAQLWRRALNERIGEEADRFVKRLRRLQSKYAMRMATVGDRICERFMRTLVIDRMRALVKPAITRSDPRAADHAFEILKEETALLVREPTGSGIDMSPWLAALKHEVDEILSDDDAEFSFTLWERSVPRIPLTLEEIFIRLSDWNNND